MRTGLAFGTGAILGLARRPVVMAWRNRRVVAVSVGFGAALAAAMLAFGARYEILVDSQTNRCLEDTRALLLDRRDRSFERGAIVAFTPPPAGAALYRDGMRFAKIVAALPGDVVEVTQDAITVNGVVVAEGLDLVAMLGVPVETYVRRFTVREGTFFPMGETRDSFDGRYYGVVDMDAGLGRAWRLF